MLIRPPESSLNAFPAELRLAAGPEHLQRALLADRIRSVEDPVLPRRQSAEDARLHRLDATETQIGLHARQGVGRQAGALFDRDAHFLVPIEIVGRKGHKTE